MIWNHNMKRIIKHHLTKASNWSYHRKGDHRRYKHKHYSVGPLAILLQRCIPRQRGCRTHYVVHWRLGGHDLTIDQSSYSSFSDKDIGEMEDNMNLCCSLFEVEMVEGSVTYAHPTYAHPIFSHLKLDKRQMLTRHLLPFDTCSHDTCSPPWHMLPRHLLTWHLLTRQLLTW